MIFERNLIISVLKLTQNGSPLIEDVKREARLPLTYMRELLEKLQLEESLYLKGNILEADSNQRLKLAVRVLSAGADIEEVAKLLRWQEFENVAAIALSNNGYAVARNLHFKHDGRRWEIDVVGCKKPNVVCIDCKHWLRGLSPSALRRIVEAQVERTMALADSLPHISIKLDCVDWKRAVFVPAILSLLPGRFKFYDEVPIVPVLQLQDFISQLPACIDSVMSISKELSHL